MTNDKIELSPKNDLIHLARNSMIFPETHVEIS